MNTGVFLTFRAVLETAIFLFWVTFGSIAEKISFFGPLSFFANQHISDAFSCLGFVFFDDMAVNILCGAYICVA